MNGAQREAQSLYEIAECDAWYEYLATVRGKTEREYAEVEPWAWARLVQRRRQARDKLRYAMRKAAA